MSQDSISDVSSKLQKIIDLCFENNAEPQFAIDQIDSFLNEYPNHHEALIFKARMLIALGNRAEGACPFRQMPY